MAGPGAEYDRGATAQTGRAGAAGGAIERCRVGDQVFAGEEFPSGFDRREFGAGLNVACV